MKSVLFGLDMFKPINVMCGMLLLNEVKCIFKYITLKTVLSFDVFVED